MIIITILRKGETRRRRNGGNENELIITRILDAPLEGLWKPWTDPEEAKSCRGHQHRIPTFKYHGRLQVAYAAFKNHCGFYLMSPPLSHYLKDQLKQYDVSGPTIHFSAEKSLPAELAKTINVRLAFAV